ncbi:uncharacterized protein LY79DRAFT_238595 [Colletotrichum navitas]|uniref:Secreted protein n=1 Tax=Colletotrichum navitas TaxID=681940 RepID=A0AAD8PX22_9PEZI|nr:uncharacterized protein LY79DRAFT_238595 [Colletotrichum navitas]KAK1589694.1 hypothetical protein LY79DRAFT_238595 [Colletotrichum navitas]
MWTFSLFLFLPFHLHPDDVWDGEAARSSESRFDCLDGLLSDMQVIIYRHLPIYIVPGMTYILGKPLGRTSRTRAMEPYKNKTLRTRAPAPLPQCSGDAVSVHTLAK